MSDNTHRMNRFDLSKRLVARLQNAEAVIGGIGPLSLTTEYALTPEEGGTRYRVRALKIDGRDFAVVGRAEKLFGEAEHE
jgi:hypothetical protein